MPAITDVKSKFSPAVTALLPLFYIGWSDSVLSPSEIKMIHRRINSMSFLTKQEQAYLIKWTDPRNPPGVEIFKEWVNAIQKHASHISPNEKHSISDLCHSMVTTMLNGDDISNIQPRLKQAINEIEEALGLDNQASLKILLDRLGAPVLPTKEKSSFDVGLMEKTLDGRFRHTKVRMRRLLEDPFFSYREMRTKEKYRAQVLEWIKALASQGLGSYAFPSRYGGGEKSGDHIAVFEMLAHHDLSLTVKFGVQFGLFGGAIYELGSESHHAHYLESLGKAELLGCFAMTESGHGSNVKGLETTATYNKSDDTIVVHTPHEGAGKEYIGNAMHSSVSVVFAQLIVKGIKHGVHAVVVPLRDAQGDLLPGIRVEDNGYKMGLNGVDNGKIWYDQVKVPRTNLLNRYGGINETGEYYSPIANPNKRFFVMLGALVAGRICVGLAGVNVSKNALAIAIRYALKRRQFEGRNESEEMLVMDYPTHQRRLIPLMARTYAYHASLSRLAVDFVESGEEERRKIETQAAGLKAIATWHCTRTVQECREACGGKGFLSENRIPDLKADSDIFTTFEGDNTVLLQLVAKGLLTEFKQAFHDGGFWAVARYLRSRIANTFAEYNPYYARLTNVSHILDRNFHRHALRYREKKLLISVAGRMQSYLQKRLHPHDAFLKCQQHMVDLGKAYVERLAFKDFLAMIDDAPDTLQPVLNKVAQLYALTCIEEDKGWFLETGYLEGNKTKAIRRVINKLCQELRYESRGLVDSWGISDIILGAEIIQ
ncbi:MAG: acyl-CoA oxidase [Saprospiraceae bacterium]|nr:acyl-CoA oxidase [Saprospiraceae bacterium]